ncbi:hypothetical protein HanRHA438_Chr08g0365741 [Helianthus annuus]|nr:hypothetical protein HanRHA438_Chr08g0365741 [Helianthus annuus]
MLSFCYVRVCSLCFVTNYGCFLDITKFWDFQVMLVKDIMVAHISKVFFWTTRGV